jgi:hypothetical protein
MVHLGVSGFVEAILSNGRLHSNSIWRLRPDQQLAPPRKSDGLAELARGFGRRFGRRKSSQIWSLASQNAAALLIDLGTVDIR